MNIILIGMMGSGKSTVGKILAAHLKWDFVDSDQLIVEEQGQSIDQIFKDKGEKTFREI